MKHSEHSEQQKLTKNEQKTIFLFLINGFQLSAYGNKGIADLQ